MYNTRVKYTKHDNYFYLRYLHIYKSLSLIHPVKLKVEIPPETWNENKQTRLEGEAWQGHQLVGPWKKWIVPEFLT